MRQHIHTEITIDASPEVVWTALTDLRSYQDWNPYHVSVEADGDLVPGRRLVVDICKPNGERVRVKPRIIRLEPSRELTWGGGIKGVFHGEHRFILEPLGSGTHLTHCEVFSGFAVRFANLDAIEEGYDSMNRALDSYIDADQAGASPRTR